MEIVTSDTQKYWRYVPLHITIVALLGAAAFGPQDAAWYSYVDNMATMLNFIAFILAIVMVFVSIAMEEAVKKHPITSILPVAYSVYWVRSVLTLIIITCIMSGWFFSAVVWTVLMICGMSIHEDIADSYKANMENKDAADS